MPILSPGIILRDWDSGTLVFKLPFEQVKTYKAILTEAHHHTNRTERDHAAHLHMRREECKGWIDEQSWNNGFYIRYLIKNLNSEAAPNGTVEVYVHFSSKATPGGKVSSFPEVLEHKAGKWTLTLKEQKVKFANANTNAGGNGEEGNMDGGSPWKRPKPVGPKPGVRRRNEGQESDDVGVIMDGGSKELQAMSVTAAAAAAAAEEKVNLLKKHISRYEKAARQPPSMNAHQARIEAPGRLQHQPHPMSADRPTYDPAPRPAPRGPGLSKSSPLTNRLVPATRSADCPDPGPAPLDETPALSPRISPRGRNVGARAQGQDRENYPSELENAGENVDEDVDQCANSDERSSNRKTYTHGWNQYASQDDSSTAAVRDIERSSPVEDALGEQSTSRSRFTRYQGSNSKKTGEDRPRTPEMREDRMRAFWDVVGETQKEGVIYPESDQESRDTDRNFEVSGDLFQ